MEILPEALQPAPVIEPSSTAAPRVYPLPSKNSGHVGGHPVDSGSVSRDLEQKVAGEFSVRGVVDAQHATEIAQSYLRLRELSTKEFLFAHALDRESARGGFTDSNEMEATRNSLKRVQQDLAVERSRLIHLSVVHGPRMAVLSSRFEMKELPSPDVLKRLLLAGVLRAAAGALGRRLVEVLEARDRERG